MAALPSLRTTTMRLGVSFFFRRWPGVAHRLRSGIASSGTATESSMQSIHHHCRVFSSQPSHQRRHSRFGQEQKQQQHQQQQQQQQHERKNTPQRHDKKATTNDGEGTRPSQDVPTLSLQDVRLPCAQHLDPTGNVLPTSDWIHINGTLPVGSLPQILQFANKLLLEEAQKGIIDLDAEWNPIQDPHVPLVSLDDLAAEGYADNNDSLASPWIQAAHVVLSPFGRPNGWHLKLANRSLVYAILARSEQEYLQVNWKTVQVQEYHYSKERWEREDPAFWQGLIVDDSMVRMENCPPDMRSDYVRYILSRYDLAHVGNTVIKWKGKTNDGLAAPLMYVVRFADSSWARAAVREFQSTVINGKEIRLVQYPKQIRYQGDS